MNNTSDGDFLPFFSEVSICAKRIIAVEDKALKSSLFSIFDKRNHGEFVSNLSLIILDLQDISNRAHLNITDMQKAKNLKNLIQEMFNYSSSLKKVCRGLNDKSMGKPYGHAEYMSDLKNVDVYKDLCSLAQAKLFQ